MRNTATLTLLAILSLLLGACSAPGQKFSGIAEPDAEMSDIYIYRIKSFVASGSIFAISVDENKVGDLYNASYLHLRVPPGAHVLRVAPGGTGLPSDLTVQLAPAKTYYYQYDFPILLVNAFFIGASIQPRSREQALLDLQELNSAKQ